MDTLRGHVNNVSCVMFHARQVCHSMRHYPQECWAVTPALLAMLTENQSSSCNVRRTCDLRTALEVAHLYCPCIEHMLSNKRKRVDFEGKGADKGGCCARISLCPTQRTRASACGTCPSARACRRSGGSTIGSGSWPRTPRSTCWLLAMTGACQTCNHCPSGKPFKEAIPLVMSRSCIALFTCNVQ